MKFVGDIAGLLGTSGLWHSSLQYAALLLLPALGGVISERSGVVNIAMEGMMLTGAFFAVVVDLSTHNMGLAVLAAMVTGGLMALIHGVVSIRFRADQIVSGVAINIFAAGLTVFLVNRLYGISDVGSVPGSDTIPNVTVPLLSSIPFVGKIFFEQNLMVYIALILLVLTQLMLFRTRLGLRIRSVGEHPQAADTAGINVYALRYGAVVTSGILSGLAGAFLSIGIANTFVPNMTNGRGYIALAAMIFGKWTPIGAFVATLIYSPSRCARSSNSFPACSPTITSTSRSAKVRSMLWSARTARARAPS
ncbi:MAG: ABC transporter permease [Chloroflexi bacterium]|nr:MAG: ABC transporter permease [Chloroflexota bacterium]